MNIQNNLLRLPVALLAISFLYLTFIPATGVLKIFGEYSGFPCNRVEKIHKEIFEEVENCSTAARI